MDLLGYLMYYGISIIVGIVLTGIAVSFLPDAVKDWIRKKLFKEKKKNE